MADKINVFKEIAPTLFNTLIVDYDYKLEQIKINKIDDKDWSIHLIYLNLENQLKIIIKQEPYYTDYGFSFVIYKLGTEQYNILYNVEHTKQDAENQYLHKAVKELFTTKETLDIIAGKGWKELKRIPFHIV